MVPPRVLEKAGKARNFSSGTGNGGLTLAQYMTTYLYTCMVPIRPNFCLSLSLSLFSRRDVEKRAEGIAV